KKLLGLSGGTLKLPISPKFGTNGPNSWENIRPLTGSDMVLSLGFCQRTWKRTLGGVPGFWIVVQSIVPGTGCDGLGLQSQALAQTTISAGLPPQSQLTLK